MASSYSNIVDALKRRKKAVGKPTLAIHLDPRLWRLVLKELSAEASYWLSEELSPSGHLLYKNCLADVSRERVSKYDLWASFMDRWVEGQKELKKRVDDSFFMVKVNKYRDELFEIHAPSAVFAEEIELAAVKVLWREGIWPESLPYDGRSVASYCESPGEGSSLDRCESGFVYFIRNKDIYKIGITTDVLRRMMELTPDEMLNVVRCKNYLDVEQAIHKKFKSQRIPQSEYFRLDREQIQEVHRLMLGLAIT